MSKVLADFHKNGYTDFNINLPIEVLKSVIKSFRNFDNNIDEEEKNKIHLRLDNNYRVSLGYARKVVENKKYSKGYFHYMPELLTQFFLKNNLIYMDFLSKISKLHDLIQIELIGFFEELIKNNIIKKEDYFEDNGKLSITLRILNYIPETNVKYLAFPHIDRGILTATIFETDPGLRFYKNSSIIDIPYKENKVKIFPAKYWNKYSIDNSPATKHDVINTFSNLERSSIVAFINPAKKSRYKIK